MQEEIAIRMARVEDAGDIAAILRALGWFDHVNLETPTQTVQRVVGQLDRCLGGDCATVLVAEGSGGRVLGYIAAHWIANLMGGLEGYVSELFVLASEHGRGVGSRLLVAIEAQGRERGCSRLMLFNRRTRDSYQRRFYPRRGWVEREDVACFMRSLEPV